jgi:peroxiredoxin
MNDMEAVESKPAPDFELVDSHGKNVKLSEFKGRKTVVLVFNRGFA